MDCRVCGNHIDPFMSFGSMPIANAFLTPEEYCDEYFYELEPAFCETCKAVQIAAHPDPQQMFDDNYAFHTRSSTHMVEHFRQYAEWVHKNYLRHGDFVVEIGCNDGAMLEHFAKGAHLGVEPSANVARETQSRGLNVVNEFFNAETVSNFLVPRRKANVILAANVICHIPDINKLMADVKSSLVDGGFFIFEEAYLGDIIAKCSYDQFYDEHVMAFSVTAIDNIVKRHGMTLIDAIPQLVHGGCMRYVVENTEYKHTYFKNVDMLMAGEWRSGLHNPKTYDDFAIRCAISKAALTGFVNDLRWKGNKTVVGYAATAKSATVLNYCGLGPDDIDYICDTTLEKQGKFSPGMHIPIVPYEQFTDEYPDYAIMFAWNHRNEILAKEKNYTGKWIEYVPEVHVHA